LSVSTQDAERPRAVPLEAGTAITWDGRPWRIVNVGRTCVALAGDRAEVVEVPLATFEELVGNGDVHGVPPVEDSLPEIYEVLAQASTRELRRANAIFDLVQAGQPAANIPPRTLRHWKQRIREAEVEHGHGYLGLLRRPNKGNPQPKLPNVSVALMDQVIDQHYETLVQRRRRAAYGELARLCAREGVLCPSYLTFCRRVKHSDHYRQALKRRGPRAAYQVGEFVSCLDRNVARHGDRPFEVAHISPNLNKILADRRATIAASKIAERVRAEVQKVFASSAGITPRFFPEKSSDIDDRPVLTLPVLSPDHSIHEPKTRELIESMTREHGTSGRTFKNALIWAIVDSDAPLREEARRALAWEDIRDDEQSLRLDETQRHQLEEALRRSQLDLKECVWRSYKNLAYLTRDNSIKIDDLGLIHSSAASSLVGLIVEKLRQSDEISEGLSPNQLTRNWSPAFKEWPTKAVRDAIYASPQFPRLLSADSIKDTIARGVTDGLLAYVGKDGAGGYLPFHFATPLMSGAVEISDAMFIISKQDAEAYRKSLEAPVASPGPPVEGGGHDPTPEGRLGEGGPPPYASVPAPASPSPATTTSLRWSGEVPALKWMNFYTKVISRFIGGGATPKITVTFDLKQDAGITAHALEETRLALRELGLDEQVETR